MPSHAPPSRTTIEARQLTLLRALLAEVAPANPFYRDRLRAAHMDATIPSLEAFAERMPFTTKAELSEDQASCPPFGTNLTYPLERYTRCHQTSGTTRAPLRWLDTPESWGVLIDDWRKVYAAAGINAADRVYFAFSFGPFIGFWMAFEAAAAMGCLCLPGGGLSSAARLASILDTQATVLCCTPTYALRLAEVAALESIDLSRSRIRTVIVAGEPGGSLPGTRARISAGWRGARVFDHHGMTEVGPVTFECQDRPCSLTVIESSYFAEILDPQSLRPVGEGEMGELVLTTLRRTGSPLLRYRTGDLVRRGAAACDGGLVLEGGILGRRDDMIVIRGANVFPSAVEEVIRAVPGVAEYRVMHRADGSMHELHIEIEPAPDAGNPEALAAKLETDLRIACSIRVPVSVVPSGSLPRFEMKAGRWVKLT